MNESEIHSALQRGGMSPSSVARRYDPLLDPQGAETLAHLLAETIRERGATAVLVWGDATDAILGFIVARRLDLPVVRLVDDDGLMEVHGSFPPSPEAVLVTDVARRDRTTTAIAAVTRQGGHLVAVAALMAERRSGPARVLALVEIDPPDEDGVPDAR